MKILKVEVKDGYLGIVFQNKYKLSVPLDEFYFLDGATDEQVCNIELLKGTKVYWPDLDETFILQNIKNRLFTNHKVHLIDRVTEKHHVENGTNRYASRYNIGYCGNSFYKRESHKTTTKIDECTCNTCMRSIKSKSRPVGHVVNYYYTNKYEHVDAPNGALWIHPIIKRVD